MSTYVMKIKCEGPVYTDSFGTGAMSVAVADMYCPGGPVCTFQTSKANCYSATGSITGPVAYNVVSGDNEVPLGTPGVRPSVVAVSNEVSAQQQLSNQIEWAIDGALICVYIAVYAFGLYIGWKFASRRWESSE